MSSSFWLQVTCSSQIWRGIWETIICTRSYVHFCSWLLRFRRQLTVFKVEQRILFFFILKPWNWYIINACILCFFSVIFFLLSRAKRKSCTYLYMHEKTDRKINIAFDVPQSCRYNYEQFIQNSIYTEKRIYTPIVSFKSAGIPSYLYHC